MTNNTVHIDGSSPNKPEFVAEPGDLDRKTCPNCGSPTHTGFGLAGGGFGPYISCETTGCWFRKEYMPDDEA